MASDEAIKETSSIIAKRIVGNMVPEDVDDCEIIIEEYFEQPPSPGGISNKKRKLGFISAGSLISGTITGLICTVIVEVVKDFYQTVIQTETEDKREKEPTDVVIDGSKLREDVYNKALKAGISKEEAEELSKLFCEEISLNPDLLTK